MSRRQEKTSEGRVLYEPYDIISPYFRKPRKASIDDIEWNRVRAGVCIGDIVYDLVNHRSIRLGHIDNTLGIRKITTKVLNETYAKKWHKQGHHDIHTQNDVTESPLLIITHEGEYKSVLEGAMVTHYIPSKQAAFVKTPIVDLYDDLDMEPEDISEKAGVHMVRILKGANQVGTPAFDKDALTIYVDDVVQWVSEDEGSSHILCNGSWLNKKKMGTEWISPIIKPNGAYYRVFNKEGTYTYSSATYRKIGTIVVVAKPKKKKSLKDFIESLKRLGKSNREIRNLVTRKLAVQATIFF